MVIDPHPVAFVIFGSGFIIYLVWAFVAWRHHHETCMASAETAYIHHRIAEMDAEQKANAAQIKAMKPHDPRRKILSARQKALTTAMMRAERQIAKVMHD